MFTSAQERVARAALALYKDATRCVTSRVTPLARGYHNSTGKGANRRRVSRQKEQRQRGGLVRKSRSKIATGLVAVLCTVLCWSGGEAVVVGVVISRERSMGVAVVFFSFFGQRGVLFLSLIHI